MFHRTITVKICGGFTSLSALHYISPTSDLLASWEELETELTERLSLCEKYTKVTGEIETAASKLEVLVKQRKKLETPEDEDIDLRKDSAQVRGLVVMM